MPGCAAPKVGIDRGEDDMVRIGPVVVQTFPHATRPFRDVSLGPALLMHCEVFVSTVVSILRPAGFNRAADSESLSSFRASGR